MTKNVTYAMPQMPIFYCPEMSVASNESVSPSAGKPRLAVEDWQRTWPLMTKSVFLGYVAPVSRGDLYLAHDSSYVDGVMDCQIENGFGNTSAEVAASLPYTVGSMVTAAKEVLWRRQKTGRQLVAAASPTSGFHHACYGYGGGFCTFNGLMVTAIMMHRLGLAERTLILDFDGHYGNGTDDIIERLGIDYVTNVTRGKCFDDRHELFEDIERRTKSKKRFDLILYQAGADMHIDDPLGAGMLTTEEMLERDRAVVALAYQHKTPIVWNLAGGYQRDANGGIEPVLALHRQTAIAFAEAL